MQEQISKVEIVLENCEMITIEGKHIGAFDLDDITYSISRIACNYIDEMYTCKNFSISIHTDSNSNKESKWTMGMLEDEQRNPLERIHKYNDITSIYVYFSNNEVPKKFYVSWSGDDYHNDYQKTYINKFGDLFIVISEENKLEDIFNLEEIEDEQYRKFIWSMYE